MEYEIVRNTEIVDPLQTNRIDPPDYPMDIVMKISLTPALPGIDIEHWLQDT